MSDDQPRQFKGKYHGRLAVEFFRYVFSDILKLKELSDQLCVDDTIISLEQSDLISIGDMLPVYFEDKVNRSKFITTPWLRKA